MTSFAPVSNHNGAENGERLAVTARLSATFQQGVQYGPVSHGRKPAHRRVESGKPLAFSLTHGALAEATAKAYRDEVGDDAHSAKRLSRILECSWRTAENYLQGRTVPNAIHMLRSYAAIPAFAAEVRRLTGMEQSLDPEFERDLSAFMQRAAGYLERRSS